MQGSGVVTPEAVQLEFEAAGIGSRAVAFLIDTAVRASLLGVLFLGVTLVAGVGAGAGVGLPPWVGITITLLLAFVGFWGYPIAFETLWRGRTLGKAALGLRVVTREGGPVRFRHAVLRAVMEIPDFWATSGAGAVVSALVTRNHQRLGDLAAGTLVLRERTGAGTPAPTRFAIPAGAESYAATIDPAGLTGDDYTAVRTFLLRAPSLRPAVRADLARRIGEPVARRVGHRLPEAVSWELFLVCVAARFQQRSAPAAPPPQSPTPAVPRGEDDSGGFAAPR
jgi:uncharacterized RDD family membrane protein YckC